jgi:O-acetyl-ADP-ribose deacetylase (regulator of RNase III)
VIRVVHENLADIATDAVIRAVRSDLSPVNAASRDLLIVAGDDVNDRFAKSGALPVGGAVLTQAGELASDFLIHVVVMSEDEPQTSVTIQKALQNGLRRATDWALESLAVPALGIGVGLIEPEVSARTLVEILFNHLDEGQPPLDLTIVVSSEYESDLFSQLVSESSRNRTVE